MSSDFAQSEPFLDDTTKIYTKKNARRRLVEEFDALTNNQDICFRVDYWDPDAPNPDIFHWQITFFPPKGTGYEGGFFKIEVKFREEYPFVAPIMKFVTKIYHCNISDEGHICLNTINTWWKKSYTMEDVLNHIIILLYKQNPDDPVNDSAAELYKENKSKFMKKVRQYIKEYANINDYDNLDKQGIPLLDKCNCFFCHKVFPSIE
jgi:ubiquitin-protein ligase